MLPHLSQHRGTYPVVRERVEIHSPPPRQDGDRNRAFGRSRVNPQAVGRVALRPVVEVPPEAVAFSAGAPDRAARLVGPRIAEYRLAVQRLGVSPIEIVPVVAPALPAMPNMEPRPQPRHLADTTYARKVAAAVGSHLNAWA